MRPMFHFTPKRIEAHVCICFVAYKVYRELERVLKLNNFDLSVEKVLNIARTITTIRVRLPHSGEVIDKTMILTKRHMLIKKLFEENFFCIYCIASVEFHWAICRFLLNHCRYRQGNVILPCVSCFF